MSKNEAKARADAKWHKKAYDKIVLDVRKDAEINRDYIQRHAESQNESVNSFIRRAIRETIELDKISNN